MAKKPATTPKIGAHDGIPKGRGRLEGKVALVMGGGSILPGWGNGKAAAVLFAIEGAKVFVVDHRKAAGTRPSISSSKPVVMRSQQPAMRPVKRT